MKYKVILGWRCEFIFDDIDVAANFATLATKARCKDNEDDRIIKIELIYEGGEDNE